MSDDTVNVNKISASSAPTSGQALTYDGSDLAWTTLTSSGTVPDATTSVKGLVQLAGDLAGTSSSPTVPGLASKATDSAVVHLAGNETITGTKNFTGALQAGGAAVVITSDARLSDTRTPTDNTVTAAKLQSNSVTAAKIADDAITEPKLNASNSPTNGQILSFNGTNFTWVAAPSGGSDPVMGGDISGSASNAQIVAGAVDTAELAASAVTAAKIADNTITEPKLAVSNAPSTNQVLSWNGSALAWVAQSGGGGSAWTATTITANTTAASGEFVIGNAASGGFTVTLPAATNGSYVTVKKLDNSVNAILVVPPSGQINAGSGTSSSISVNNYGMVADFIADGTQWHQVG